MLIPDFYGKIKHFEFQSLTMTCSGPKHLLSKYVVWMLGLTFKRVDSIESLTTQQNFGLVQMESICRHGNIWDKNRNLIWEENIMRKCRLPACFPFPTMFLKASFAIVMFLMIDVSHCDRIHSFLTTVHCFSNGYVEKQPVTWKEYFAEYW